MAENSNSESEEKSVIMNNIYQLLLLVKQIGNELHIRLITFDNMLDFSCLT